ncbi:hypothetical protein BGZ83_010022 [Gryganskiella cystojenkinii]|nr:hypothetical protein BGZ83_010022 [Gryganskiella cystojenkinii]
MTFLRTTFSRAIVRASTVRSSAVVPSVSIFSHQNRFFTYSPQNFKKDQLKSAPGWREEDASESEADIKADREPLPRGIKELQKESIETLEEHKNQGKTVEGFGSFNKAVNDFRHEFEKKVESTEDGIHVQGKKVVKEMKHKTEAWKNSAEHEADSIKDEIKSGAKKVSSFMDSVKRSLHLDGHRKK